MIKLITGAMGSGKSAELLKSILEYEGKKSLVVKPTLDTRTPNMIKSRNGLSTPAIEVEGFCSLTAILMNNNDIEVIFIDELQFLDDNCLREFVIFCKRKNIDVIASGLDLTSELRIFDTVAKFACYANEVVKVKGICKRCGNSSSLSEFIGDRKGDIKIGDEEYIGVCSDCHKLIGVERTVEYIVNGKVIKREVG